MGCKRVISTPVNDAISKINDQFLVRFDGEVEEYKAVDNVLQVFIIHETILAQ